MKIPPPLQTIINVALIRYIALCFDDLILPSHVSENYISVFHYAANAVCVFALLISGYWSALGIASGSTVWNIVHTSISFTSHVQLFLASVVSCSLTLLIYKTLIQKTNEISIWERPSPKQFYIFTLIFSLLIVGAAQIAFIRIPEINPLSILDLMKMLLGNFIAVTIVYLLLNLAMTFYIAAIKIFNNKDQNFL